MKIFKPFIQLLKQEDGVTLVEFAFVFPVMLTFLIGTMEVSNLLRLDRKITYAAHTAVDLISQNRSIDDDTLADIYKASELAVFPFAEGHLAIGITTVEFDPDDGSASIGWNESLRAGSVEGAVAKVEGLGTPGHSVIVASVTYAYQPIFADLIFSGFDVEETAFTRPRNSLLVTRE